ncbi:hypothetical protein JW848_06140 [Candidatus Bipolaricaulota bacterium]|nr:hypothetical protein [Candidatus Bipolaricaulota bacterium]
MITRGGKTLRARPMKGLVWLILLATLTATITGMAGGLGFGFPFYTINVLPAVEQAPVIMDQAAEAWEAALIADGLPPEVARGLAAEIEAVGDQIAASIPSWTTGTPGILLQAIPIPHIGGAIEFGLPFVVLDTLRFEAGWLSETLVLKALDLAGLGSGLEDWPLVIDWDEALLWVEPEVRSMVLSTDVAKQIGLLVADIDLGIGVDLIAGRVLSGISVEGGLFQETIHVLISELQLESLRWTAFAVHGSIGIGIGPPFLRLYARLRGMVPISQSVSGGWAISIGGLSGSVGMVIRF